MSRTVIVLASQAERQKVASWAMSAPLNTHVTFTESKRSLPQSARMWACLTDIATALPWHGVRLSPASWKLIFLDALKQEINLAPNLAGTGFVNLGRSSSELTKDEMGQLLELIAAFAAEHNVTLHDRAEAA